MKQKGYIKKPEEELSKDVEKTTVLLSGLLFSIGFAVMLYGKMSSFLNPAFIKIIPQYYLFAMIGVIASWIFVLFLIVFVCYVWASCCVDKYKEKK